jgi:DNA-binding CsgD family transcriptional regulator
LIRATLDGMRPGALERAMEAASEAVTLAELDASFLPIVEDALGAAGSLLFSFGADGRPRGLSGSVAPHIAGYNARVFGQDPLQSALRRAGPMKPSMELEDVLPYDELRASPAFHEFYRPLGFERMIGLLPTERRFGAPGMVGLIVGRPRSTRPFSARERRAFASLLPALRAVVARDGRGSERAYAELALRRALPRPVIVLDHRGTLLWRSPRAEALLEREPALARALADAARRAALRPRAHAIALALATGHHARVWIDRLADGGVAVVAVIQEGRACGEDLLAAAGAFGLTGAEKNVLACVACGLDNRAIAAELHVSEATVKTHLHNVLAKLGVTNRTQAALVAHGLLHPDATRSRERDSSDPE